MADTGRTPADSLKKLESLQAAPYRYNYFSAIRMLDCVFSDSRARGLQNRPAHESFRIGQLPTLKFAPASLSAFFGRKHGHWFLQTYFFGLFGPNGPLPQHLTDYTQQRMVHHRDQTLAAFVDIFHHRMATFFYRAWPIASRRSVGSDRPASDRFKTYVSALCGFRNAELAESRRDA